MQIHKIKVLLRGQKNCGDIVEQQAQCHQEMHCDHSTLTAQLWVQAEPGPVSLMPGFLLSACARLEVG